MNKKINKLVLVSILVMFAVSIYSQTRTNSPYSIYGVGLLNDNSNPISFAMGGIGVAFYDNASVNPANPASFAAIDRQSFIFDAGFLMNSSKLSDGNVSEKASYSTLNHLLFGFPLGENWKVGFGVLPFSDVGYSINATQQGDVIDVITESYEGSGGMTKAFITNAFKIRPNLFVGIEIGYMFGKIEHIHYTLFPEEENIFNNKQTGKKVYKDFYLRYGIQYTKEIKKDLNLTLGATYATKTKIKTDSTSLFQTILGLPVAGVSSFTSNIEEANIEGNTELPATIALGLMLHKTNHWKIGVDFEHQEWSDYKSFDKNGNFNNSIRISVGGEFIPDYSNVFSYYKRVKYRIGFRYEKTPFEFNNDPVKEFGISFGLGLPLKRSLSAINLGFEIGQTGKVSDALVRDSFFKFKMGISMHQIRWFVQRKYY